MRLPARLLPLLLLAGMLCPLPATADEPQSVADLGGNLAEKYRDQHPTLWGEHLPGVTDFLPPSGKHGEETAPSRTLALTFDACDGGTDMRILALLRALEVPATIFVTNQWLRRNMATARDLASDPLFSLACHGKRHKPASVAGKKIYGIVGTRNVLELVEEVEDNARSIEAVSGVRPRWYRSGTAHYDDVALRVIADLGFSAAGYAVSADQGATLPAGSVARAILKAPDRGIILCHLNHPESGTYAGLAAAIPALLAQGVKFVPLKTPGSEEPPS